MRDELKNFRDELKDYIEGAQYVVELNDALQKEAQRLRAHSTVIAPVVYEEISDLIQSACNSAGLVRHGSDGSREDLHLPVAEVVSLFREDLLVVGQSFEVMTADSLRECAPDLPDERVAITLHACHHLGRELCEALLATENTTLLEETSNDQNNG